MLLPIGQTSLSVSLPLDYCPCQILFLFFEVVCTHGHICRSILHVPPLPAVCQQHSNCANMHARVLWEEEHGLWYTQANETLHFMLHETENGIWKEVDSASSQRTRGSLSITPQGRKKYCNAVPARSSKHQWTSQAVTANNKLTNDTVIMWLVQMKRFSNSVQWDHKSFCSLDLMFSNRRKGVVQNASTWITQPNKLCSNMQIKAAAHRGLPS